MIRITLPFSMGKTVVSVNPMFDNEIKHPVLEIGSSFAGLKYEVQTWLCDHVDGWHFGFYDGNYFIEFEKDIDATIFSLRWF